MIDLFFSYAHEDEDLRNELEVHLALLKRQGLIRAWHDRRIVAGQDVHGAISGHLESAHVILLLVSPHFLASDYCYEVEARRALERHVAGDAVVIPVILQPCDWLNSPLGKLRATPRDGKPVAKFPNVNEALLQVTQDIREAAQQLGRDKERPAPAAAVQVPSVDQGVRSSNLRVKRSFSDRDRDAFIDETLAYIEKFFENSLDELAARNSGIEHRFKKIDASSFSAAVYVNGQKRTSCRIWTQGRRGFGGDIAYSASDAAPGNSFNESMNIEDDGYQLGLRPLGMSMTIPVSKEPLGKQGAAEYFWAMFIAPLQ